MSLQPELPCWKIIQCTAQSTSVPGEDLKKACWEMVNDDDAGSFHICVDCLVYLARAGNSILNEDDFCSLLALGEQLIYKKYQCNLSHVLLLFCHPGKLGPLGFHSENEGGLH